MNSTSNGNVSPVGIQVAQKLNDWVRFESMASLPHPKPLSPAISRTIDENGDANVDNDDPFVNPFSPAVDEGFDSDSSDEGGNPFHQVAEDFNTSAADVIGSSSSIPVSGHPMSNEAMSPMHQQHSHTHLKPALPPRPAKLSSNQELSLSQGGSSIDVKPPLPARPNLTSIDMSTLSINVSSSSLMSATSTARAMAGQVGTGMGGGHRSVLDRNTLFIHTTDANRRLPLSTFTAPLQLKASPNCIVTSRGYVVTATSSIKIFSAQTGECTLTLQPSKPELKVLAMGFVPSMSREHDGKYLWVGFSDGDLWMVNIFTGEVCERRVSAHSYAVNFILRYRTNMCTLDDNGVLQVWTETRPQTQPIFNVPSQQGTSQPVGPHVGHIVSLEGRPRSMRLAAKQVAALFVGNQLWVARERSIELVCPFDDGAQKMRIECPSGLGAITCLGCTSTTAQEPPVLGLGQKSAQTPVQLGMRAYSGHIDGKVVEWDPITLTKRRVFDVGSYRVASLMGISDRLLWVGFGTGKITVLDVGEYTAAVQPTSSSLEHQDLGRVVALKEWQADTNDSIECLYLDPDSLVHVGQLIVASASKGGRIHLWDALMPKDFIDMEMKIRESEYCKYDDLKLLVLSWNIDASKPDALDLRGDDAYFLDKWATSVTGGADLIFVGFQEIIDLESKKIAARGIFKNATKKADKDVINEADHAHRANAWRDKLTRTLRGNFKHPYQLLETRNMVGLFTCVFIKEELASSVTNLASHTVSTGLGGTYGNKGAIITRLCVRDSSFCFVTSHLPAHQTNVGKRNVDAITILRATGLPAVTDSDEAITKFVRGGDGTYVLDHEFSFFLGDLNYRIDIERDRCLRLIEEQDWKTLWSADQLIRQLQSHTTSLLRIFNEGPLAFAPTYKYDPGTDLYDSSEKKRVPAWCDRILYRDGFLRHLSSAYDPSRRLTLEDQANNISVEMKRLKQHEYRRHECRVSDHRPISSVFTVTLKSNKSPEAYGTARNAAQAVWDDHYRHVVWEGLLRWMLHRLEPLPSGTDVIQYKAYLDSTLRQSQGDVSAAMKTIMNIHQ